MDQPLNDTAATASEATDVGNDVVKAVTAATPRRAKADRAKTDRKPRAKKAAPARAAKPRRAYVRKAKPAADSTAATAAPALASTPRLDKEMTMKFDPTNWMKNFTNFGSNLNTLPGSEGLQAMFSDAGSRGQQALERSRTVAEEVVAMTRANVEAIAETGRIAAAGAKSISETMLERSRTGLEQAAAEVKTLTGAQSPTEFFQRQSEIARAQFDRAVADGSRFTETLVKLAGEAMQPLSSQAAVNADKLNTIAA